MALSLSSAVNPRFLDVRIKSLVYRDTVILYEKQVTSEMKKEGRIRNTAVSENLQQKFKTLLKRGRKFGIIVR